MESPRNYSKRPSQQESHQPVKSSSNKMESCCHNLQIFKVILVIFAIIGSLFASILLVIAGDPPYNQGTFYQYGDLIRLVSGIHLNDQLVKSNVNDSGAYSASADSMTTIQKREVRSRLKDLLKFDLVNMMTKENLLEANRFGKLLKKWWPNMKRADFQSHDPILDDANFYWKNYTIFQTGFIILLLLSNFLLLLTWVFFKILKNFRKSKLAAEEENSNRKSFINKQFKNVKQFRNFKKTRISHRMVLLFILFQLALIFILLVRPNFFVVVLHQVCFLLLAVGCLASTSIRKRIGGQSSSTEVLLDAEHRQHQKRNGGSPSFKLNTPKIPSIDLKSPKIPSLKLKSPKIPSVELNTPTLPSMKLKSPDLPSIELKSPNIPSVELKSPAIPSVELNTKVPSVEMKSPKMPSLNLKSADLPSMEIKSPTIPSVEIKAPNIPSLELKSPNLPSVEFKSPNIPSMELNAKIPSVELKAPKIPSVELKASLPSVELKSPEIPSIEMKSPKIPSMELKASELSSWELTNQELNPSSSDLKIKVKTPTSPIIPQTPLKIDVVHSKQSEDIEVFTSETSQFTYPAKKSSFPNDEDGSPNKPIRPKLRMSITSGGAPDVSAKIMESVDQVEREPTVCSVCHSNASDKKFPF